MTKKQMKIHLERMRFHLEHQSRTLDEIDLLMAQWEDLPLGPRLLKAVSLQLGVSVDRLKQDVRTGLLRAVKKAGQWYVEAVEIERYRVEVLGREPVEYTLMESIRVDNI